MSANPQHSASVPLVAATVCIVLSCGVAVIPVLGFISWIIAAPLLLTAFILSIIALSRGAMMSGIATLLFSVIIAPLVVVFAPIFSTFLGVGAVSIAQDANARARKHAAEMSARNSATSEPVNLTHEAEPGAPAEVPTSPPAEADSAPTPPTVTTPAPAPPIEAPVEITALEAQQEAIRAFPQLGVAGSSMNLKFVNRVKQLKVEKPATFNDPHWPLKLAHELQP